MCVILPICITSMLYIVLRWAFFYSYTQLQDAGVALVVTRCRHCRGRRETQNEMHLLRIVSRNDVTTVVHVMTYNAGVRPSVLQSNSEGVMASRRGRGDAGRCFVQFVSTWDGDQRDDVRRFWNLRLPSLGPALAHPRSQPPLHRQRRMWEKTQQLFF